MNMMTLNRYKGFTLIELMVTILIAAILMMIAVPSFRNYQANQQVRSTAQGLVLALDIARSEAIKRGTGVTAIVAPVSGTDWSSGWTVSVGATTLQNFGAVAGATVTADTTTSSLVYDSSGRLNSSVKFTVAPTGTSGVASRCVKTNLSGKATSGGCS